jgi:branched-chain amino acid transport system ATP-binding protein
MSSLLEVSDLDAGYAGWQVLQGVEFRAEQNRITGIIGPNGSGKSTLLKAVVGMVAPQRGSVHFNGQDITGMPTFDVVTHGLAYIPQGKQIFPEMTVYENLQMAAYTIRDRQLAGQRFEEVYDHFPFIAKNRRQRAGTLSGGEQSLLSFGMALVLEPKCLLLDEPSLGLAPQLLHQIFETVIELHERGLTFVIIEQNVRALLDIVDDLAIVDSGRIAYLGPAKGVHDEDELMRMYVGLGASS